ncbi:hypothetical protein AAFF_G00127950 [Aldrovandia affinis]|uniref:Uncharacterized protein n=1 Tax=Aldrovandia affinis TaxID=143900 RepID=A0AAD7T143_9TELE|nr:hypothetical protein AAFF_G00127950 [Aldrovandia affinis]
MIQNPACGYRYGGNGNKSLPAFSTRYRLCRSQACCRYRLHVPPQHTDVVPATPSDPRFGLQKGIWEDWTVVTVGAIMNDTQAKTFRTPVFLLVISVR